LGKIDQNMNEINVIDSVFSCWQTADEVLIHIHKHHMCETIKTLSMTLNLGPL